MSCFLNLMDTFLNEEFTIYTMDVREMVGAAIVIAGAIIISLI